MNAGPSKPSMEGLLDGLSDLEVQELCTGALREWHSQFPDRREFSIHGDLGRRVVPLLLDRKGVQVGEDTVNRLKEGFLEVNLPHMAGVAEFVSWLVRAGFAWPL